MHTNNILELEDGFYYYTEDDDLQGPFPSLLIAQQCYDAHFKWLERDHQAELRKMRDYYE